MKKRNRIFIVIAIIIAMVVSFEGGKYQTLRSMQSREERIQQAEEDANEHYNNWFTIGNAYILQTLTSDEEVTLEEIYEILESNPSLEDEEKIIGEFIDIIEKSLSEDQKL